MHAVAAKSSSALPWESETNRSVAIRKPEFKNLMSFMSPCYASFHAALLYCFHAGALPCCFHPGALACCFHAGALACCFHAGTLPCWLHTASMLLLSHAASMLLLFHAAPMLVAGGRNLTVSQLLSTCKLSNYFFNLTIMITEISVYHTYSSLELDGETTWLGEPHKKYVFVWAKLCCRIFEFPEKMQQGWGVSTAIWQISENSSKFGDPILPYLHDMCCAISTSN